MVSVLLSVAFSLALSSVSSADTHDVYASTGHFSSYLRNTTTSVQCAYIPVSDLRDVLGVNQWPIQLGGVLLAFASTHHRVTPVVRTGHSVTLIM